MPGLLITPEQYSREILNRTAQDFAGWQVKVVDHATNTGIYGEILKIECDRTVESLIISWNWAAWRFDGAEFKKLHRKVLRLDLRGRRDDSATSTPVKVTLFPPGTWERSEHASAWNHIKRVGQATP